MTSYFLIILLLSLAYGALLVYYRIAWKKIHPFEPVNADPSGGKIFITVIIPARNEEQNIRACLQSIQGQSYPSDLFEVLVVDDHSEDGTAEIVTGFRGNIRVIKLASFVDGEINSYKKRAIEVAVAQARGQLIVTTDADCIAPPDWLQTIAGFHAEKKAAFIAAPVAIQGKRTLLNIFQSLDFLSLQGITAAAVSKKQMTMCNGANLAYETAAFKAVDGFAGVDKLASGDDMFLMHKIFQHDPEHVFYLHAKSAIVKTAPAADLKTFLRQRIRWASKANHYRDKRILPVLILVYLLNLGLLFSPLFSRGFSCCDHCVRISRLTAVMLPLVIKTIAELYFLFPVAGFFGKRKELRIFPFLQPFHILYTVVAGTLGNFKTYSWKGRKVK